MLDIIYWTIQSAALAGLAIMVVACLREWTTIWAISKQTFREATRKNTFWLVIIFAVVLLTCTVFVQAVGPGALKEERRIRFMLQIGFWMMSFLSVLAAIFLASFSLPTDIATRIVYTILSKPVSRWALMAGKILGYTIVTFALLCFMGFFFIIVTSISSIRTPPEVRDHLLKARKVYKASEMNHLVRRRAVTLQGGIVQFNISHYIPGQSRYRFSIRKHEAFLQENKRLAFRMLIVPMREYRDKWLEEQRRKFREKKSDEHAGKGGEERRKAARALEQELENQMTKGEVVVELSNLETGHKEQHVVSVNLKDGMSADVPIGPELLSSGKVGLSFLKMEPSYEWVPGRIAWIRYGETLRWTFRPVSREQLLYHPVALDADNNKGSGGAGSADEGPRIRVQARFKIRNIVGARHDIDARATDVDIRVIKPGGQEAVETLKLHLRDSKTVFFDISPGAVSGSGEVILELVNPRGAAHFIGYNDRKYGLKLLSRPGSFTLNLLRAIVIVSFQAILLIVVAVSASTFMSWPVTALTTIFVYICGIAVQSFDELLTAVRYSGIGTHGHAHHHGATILETSPILRKVVETVLEVLGWVMPDLSKFNPAYPVSLGYAIDLVDVLRSFAYLSIFVTLVLAIGWLIFRKRSVD